jgi:hypothetical protein
MGRIRERVERAIKNVNDTWTQDALREMLNYVDFELSRKEDKKR